MYVRSSLKNVVLVTVERNHACRAKTSIQERRPQRDSNLDLRFPTLFHPNIDTTISYSCPHPSPATSHLHIGNNQNETGDWGSGRVSRSILGLQSQYTTVLAPMFYSASPYFKARFPLSISVFIYVHSTGHFGRTLPLCLRHLQHTVDSLPTTSTN